MELSNRRQFIKTAAAAVASFNIVPRHVLGGPGHVAPSEKVNVALVGAGGRGLGNLRELMQLDDVQVIALADPAESYSRSVRNHRSKCGRVPARAEIEKHYEAKTPNYRCAVYEDYRVMLEKEKAIDAVLCATTDHVHAHISIMAMRAGRHVYCEKPLTRTVEEARYVAQVARETGVAAQMGNQGHSTLGIRRTVEYLRDGAIGTVREVHSWVSNGRYKPALLGKPAESAPVPDGLNWDLWLGPAEHRAFNAAYFPVNWRDFWAFGCSTIGDFACHDLDAATWAFDLRHPTRIEGLPVGPTNDEIGPHGSMIYYDFPARGDYPALKVNWYDGGLKPRAPEALGNFPLPDRGVLFIGDKGAIECDGAGGPPRLFPESLRAGYEKPAATLKRSAGHHRDWIDACKGDESASSHFEYGARLTEIALLGVLAIRAGRPIEWDAAAMRVKGLPEAEPLLRASYRKGWELM
ncbi:MAG: Gfo/Idh/MocA family protein [Opitutaceae bacterium]